MNTMEAKRFLEAFADESAGGLVEEMLLRHYANAVIEHHPGPVDRELVYKSTRKLRDEILVWMDRIRERPGVVDAVLQKLSRTIPFPHPMWFEAFNLAYEHYKHERKLPLKTKRIEAWFTGDSFCDVGCGGGDLIYYISRNYPGFREFAGIDVLDWRTDAIRNSINFQMLDFSRSGAKSSVQYDTLSCIAVLHHVGQKVGDISTFLRNLRTALRPGGRLIIEEDVMLPSEELARNPQLMEQAERISGEQPLFGKFLNLDTEAQKNVLILVDILANALTGELPIWPSPLVSGASNSGLSYSGKMATA